VNDIIRLQALDDKKKVVVMEATIREALRLDNEEGVECLSNEEIFTELARMGYEKPSTKLTRVSKGFYGIDTPLFEGDVSTAHREVHAVAEEPSIPSPTPPTPPPQPSQDIPSTSLLKRRVKKLEKRNKVRVLKLRRLQRVKTTQRVKAFDETVLDDVSNQGRMIAKMAHAADVVLEDDKEVADEAKEVVTTTKLITEVFTAANETITATSTNIITAKAQVPAATIAVILTAAPARVSVAPSRRRKGVDEAIDHLKRKAKEDSAMKRYQVLKRKPQTKAQARKNMMYVVEDDGKMHQSKNHLPL
nr:hypothetical protein [Tanacetum cinerariifolium]